MRLKELEDKYGLGQMQDFVSFYNIIMECSISIIQVDQYIKKKKKEFEQIVADERKKIEKKNIKEIEDWENVAPKCPECGSTLMYPTKLSGEEAPNNLNGWSCYWGCSNEDCLWEEYSYENVQALIDGFLKGELDGYNFSG